MDPALRFAWSPMTPARCTSPPRWQTARRDLRPHRTAPHRALRPARKCLADWTPLLSLFQGSLHLRKTKRMPERHFSRDGIRRDAETAFVARLTCVDCASFWRHEIHLETVFRLIGSVLPRLRQLPDIARAHSALNWRTRAVSLHLEGKLFQPIYLRGRQRHGGAM